jgi:hypothetical protein
MTENNNKPCSVVTSEEIVGYSDLQIRLENIVRMDGVLGYIHKDEETATVNLKGHDKIQEFALWSSAVIETVHQLDETFELGGISESVAEFEHLKLLLLIVPPNVISVFIEKSADEIAIKRNLLDKQIVDL